METIFPTGSRRTLPPVPRPTPRPGMAADAAPSRGGTDDEGQDFVSRLRTAAAQFARAAGAQTAVVREAVPPARHRRARCRVVLRNADGTETDLTFLGPAGRPARGFDTSIQRWLGEGQRRHPAWLVGDDDAPDGVAIDVAAWLARS